MSVLLWLSVVLLMQPGYSILSGECRRRSPAMFEYTGIQRELSWKYKLPPVSKEQETRLRDSDVLIQQGEFGSLTDARRKEIEHACEALGMEPAQGLSMRKQSTVNKIMQSNWRLQRDADKLSRLLQRGSRILKLSQHLDQPPMSIIRAILSIRVRERYPNCDHEKQVIQAIINDELASPHLDDFLSPREQKQLLVARQSDAVSYVSPREAAAVQEASAQWEQALYNYLDEHSIHYVPEQQLREAGLKRTPDCLILDECTINGKHVRWIDSKNYFGTGAAKHFIKKAKRQTQKYEEEFGDSGAIVYRHGFSRALAEGLPTTLLLDCGPLKEPDYIEPV